MLILLKVKVRIKDHHKNHNQLQKMKNHKLILIVMLNSKNQKHKFGLNLFKLIQIRNCIKTQIKYMAYLLK